LGIRGTSSEGARDSELEVRLRLISEWAASQSSSSDVSGVSADVWEGEEMESGVSDEDEGGVIGS
jgi:hypothetical protein